MACIQINKLNYSLPCGKVLISDLNLSLNPSFYSLLGDNGSGKSTLAKLLVGELLPGSGTIVCEHKLAYLPQLTQITAAGRGQTVAQFLAIDKRLAALARIQAGGCAVEDFELVNDNWLLAQQTQQQLAQAGLNIALEQACAQLSGGEFTRLQLLKLLAANPDFLVLDEPSNHLDSAGKAWLTQTLREFNGGILLISHDRELLMLARQTIRLHRGDVSLYGGNYRQYCRRHTALQQGIERRLKKSNEQLTALKNRQQASAEKAQKRRQKGQQSRQGGGQAKALLDFKKNKAQAGASGRLKQNSRQQAALSEQISAAKAGLEQNVRLNIKLAQAREPKQSLLTVENLKLPFCGDNALNFVLAPGDKLHLSGVNGSGKSTLLTLVANSFSASPEQVAGIKLRARPVYFDQFFSPLAFEQKPSVNMLDALAHFCPRLGESQSRAALAALGFRAELASKSLASLSGGEIAKLSIAIISQLSDGDLLLLDEPDNHLDIRSKELFARALADFNGSFILISHDTAFLRQAGITRQMSLS
ncbi:ATP-binding cassette domain-containing protein [Thalassomonas haliotis]|uniref:ABC-F family ATP-binding cassette domain-containing protein n=1 Tax=Thalassomonas haliotis TaxID=485448 RepID=A0ABY7VIX0_9GAMM|nr:ATP-binding cassette domain-containing protein [Thalassomonas haliotis]WDE13468.1 ABC-F family ATP-binding cassette domain-containing protein [Thalassomonas haliotis]